MTATRTLRPTILIKGSASIQRMLRANSLCRKMLKPRKHKTERKIPSPDCSTVLTRSWRAIPAARAGNYGTTMLCGDSIYSSSCNSYDPLCTGWSIIRSRGLYKSGYIYGRWTDHVGLRRSSSRKPGWAYNLVLQVSSGIIAIDWSLTGYHDYLHICTV